MKSQNTRELNNVLTKNMNLGVRQTMFQILPLSFSNCEIVLGTQDIPLSTTKISIFMQVTLLLLEINVCEWFLK